MATHISTILIVDDDMISILLLQNMLEKEGYNVYTADSGKKGRQLAMEKKPDLLLLDVMMPGEDGFVTCRKLKANAATANLPIIFISALGDLKSRVRGLDLGGWDFISKPFHKEEVLARVRNYLKLRFTYLRVIEEQARRLSQIHDAQQAILIRPEEIPGAKFAVHYLSIREAGGDFYDVFPVGNDDYIFFVSDISGHDLGASFATSALKALIRQNTVDVYTAEETMQMINQVLTQIFVDGQHLTAIFARLDRSRGLLTLINAAHLPLFYLPAKGEMQLLEADGDIVGAFANGIYNSRQISVRRGDRFFMCTDGLLELFSGKFSRDRAQGLRELERFCLEARGLPVAQAVKGIVEKMFSGMRQPEDDVILLGVDI